jgi:hypothetical protein
MEHEETNEEQTEQKEVVKKSLGDRMKDYERTTLYKLNPQLPWYVSI